VERLNLSELFGVPEGTRYVFLHCPAHGDQGRPNLAVYPDGAYCFACGYRESPADLLARIGPGPHHLPGGARGGRGTGGIERDWEAGVRGADLPPWEGAFQERQRSPQDRGISATLARRFRIGYSGVSFVLPYRDEDGRVIGYKERADPELSLPWRYRNTPGLGTRLFRPNPTGGPMVVVEGEFDALALAELGVDGVTTATGAGGLMTLPLPRRRGLVATDWDEAGEQAAAALLRRYPGLRRLPPPAPGVKDVSEWLGKLPVGERWQRLRRWLEGE